MPRLLILTLSSGEAALPVLTRQLTRQSFQDFEHEIISGLPNRAAHARLYKTVMDQASCFDLFLKLDADMTLRSDGALADVVRAIDEHPAHRHFAFRIWDCFTEEETLGVHVFRSGVRWNAIDDSLFVDPDPHDANQILWDGPPAPFVNHGEIVSDFECFAFGVHKFLKVAQRGRTLGGLPQKTHKYFRHMRNCARIRDLYRTTRARRHLLALAGVVWAMRHDAVSVISNKAELRRVFDVQVQGHEESWARRVGWIANSVLIWRLALVRSLGVRRGLG